MIIVLDPVAARAAMAAGEVVCPRPGCGGRLRVWSRARERRVRGRDGTWVRLRPDRGKCRACARSHVLLPAGYLPRHAYNVQVIGAALLGAAEGAGYRRVAAGLNVPASTVRGWLNGLRARSTGTVAEAVAVIRAAGLDLHPPGSAPVWSGQALPEAVAALGTAARGFAAVLAGPPRPRLRAVPVGSTGIDYLWIIGERHRQALHTRLGVIDPTGLLAGLRGWALINVLTRGRLLTTGPDG